MSEVIIRSDLGELEAAFVPGAGMVCRSLRHRGQELLAQRAGVAEYADRGATMGIPLLYPWANRLAAHRYAVAGKTVDLPEDDTAVAHDPNGLPIHGVLPDLLDWRIAGGPDRSRVSAELRWDTQRLLALFPFRHTVRYDAHIDGGTLSIAVSVDATGPDRVPVSFGFHPYLRPAADGRPAWQLELPTMEHLSLDRRSLPDGGRRAALPRALPLGDLGLDDGFAGLPEPATFAVHAPSRSIVVGFMQGYPYAQIYAPADQTFVCFEPMTAPTNALCDGHGLRILEPGQQHRAELRISVRDSAR